MKNFLKKFKLKPKNHTDVDRYSVDPHKHWVILLWFFFVSVVLLIMYSIYLLYQIKNENLYQTPLVKKVESTQLRENLLKSVTAEFEQKAKNENDIETNPTTYPDPSK